MFVSRVVREDEGNACSHQNQSSEKERAESGPVTCFQTDTRTESHGQRGDGMDILRGWNTTESNLSKTSV